jgi:hypothetical protein
MRRWAWTSRAAHEQAFAKHTWFITLTFKPSERYRIAQSASLLDASKSSPDRRLVAASGTYISAYFRTLRREGYEIRYCCVPELHRNGFPHWHGLVHDQSGSLTWKGLSTAWTAGWSVCKLVKDAKAIRYVTKYLAKDRIGRVRASLEYGAPLGPTVLS